MSGIDSSSVFRMLDPHVSKPAGSPHGHILKCPCICTAVAIGRPPRSRRLLAALLETFLHPALGSQEAQFQGKSCMSLVGNVVLVADHVYRARHDSKVHVARLPFAYLIRLHQFRLLPVKCDCEVAMVDHPAIANFLAQPEIQKHSSCTNEKGVRALAAKGRFLADKSPRLRF
jgi:hypothetical protein